MSDEAMVTEHSDDQHGDEGQAGGKVITVISCYSQCGITQRVFK